MSCSLFTTLVSRLHVLIWKKLVSRLAEYP